jgi:hypothetical protein
MRWRAVPDCENRFPSCPFFQSSLQFSKVRLIDIVVLSLICALVLVVGYWLWRPAARPTSRRYGWQRLWRLACVIGSVRIVALWLGAATNYSSGWVQIPGFFLQLIGLPEIYLARGMRTTCNAAD